MIVLPTRRRLERRRDALYKQLHLHLQCLSVREVEDIMRKIHGINFKLVFCFSGGIQHEATELFEDKDDFEVKNSFEEEEPTEISIEEALREIEL